jgi:hypothetical protein
LVETRISFSFSIPLSFGFLGEEEGKEREMVKEIVCANLDQIPIRRYPAR